MNSLSLPLTALNVRFGQVHDTPPEGRSAEFSYEGKTYWVSNNGGRRDEDYDTFRDTQSAQMSANLDLNSVKRTIAESGGKRYSLKTDNDNLLKDLQSAATLAELALNGLKRRLASRINPDVINPDF